MNNLPENYRLVTLDSVGSTNEEAKRVVECGTDGAVVITAKSQTEGRGRYDRKWISGEGNLYASILLPVDFVIEDAAQLSFVTAIAARYTLAKNDAPIKLKWPNDLLINGKKCGGILLESYRSGNKDYIIIGIGVNIRNHPQNTEYPATSLHMEGVGEAGVENILSALVRNFDNYYNLWCREGFAEIREKWLENAVGIGENIKVRTGKDTITGIFEDIDSNGALILRLEDGNIKTITAGDVFFG